MKSLVWVAIVSEIGVLIVLAFIAGDYLNDWFKVDFFPILLSLLFFIMWIIQVVVLIRKTLQEESAE